MTQPDAVPAEGEPVVTTTAPEPEQPEEPETPDPDTDDDDEPDAKSGRHLTKERTASNK